MLLGIRCQKLEIPIKNPGIGLSFSAGYGVTSGDIQTKDKTLPTLGHRDEFVLYEFLRIYE